MLASDCRRPATLIIRAWSERSRLPSLRSAAAPALTAARAQRCADRRGLAFARSLAGLTNDSRAHDARRGRCMGAPAIVRSICATLDFMPTPDTVSVPEPQREPVGVLRALEAARAQQRLSKADLARRSKLPAETVRRLLTAADANPTLDTVFELLRPLGLGLQLAPFQQADEAVSADPKKVRVWLARYGAPLHGARQTEGGEPLPRPEYVLAEALKLSREDAAVARTLPVALWRARGRLNFPDLRRLAVERHQARTLGFFLELTAELANEPTLARAARPLRRTPQSRRASQFFRVRSRLERQLAELKTPALARRWGFRMNMGQDSFESMFRKETA
jgi:transcriptional regulator with XRE-family HTH domain